MKLTIYIEPTAKAKPGIARRGGRVIAYTPSKTAHAEQVIRAHITHAQVFFERHQPIRLDATFYRTRPQKAPKRLKLPITRPDCINYGQLLQDALQGFLFADDAQITTLILRKAFGRPPRIELEVTEDEERSLNNGSDA